MDGPNDLYPPTTHVSALAKVIRPLSRPVLWFKLFIVVAVMVTSVEVFGYLGFPVGALIIGAYLAVRALIIGVFMTVMAGWAKSPVAIVIAILGIVFLGLYFVHYNSLTCTLKGGWVINVGSGNALCIGPS